MTWLTRLMERTEYVKGLQKWIAELEASNSAFMDQFTEMTIELAQLRNPRGDGLPFCVKCHQGRKRGQKFTELTFVHDHCPADHCEVVGAVLPTEVGE